MLRPNENAPTPVETTMEENHIQNLQKILKVNPLKTFALVLTVAIVSATVPYALLEEVSIQVVADYKMEIILTFTVLTTFASGTALFRSLVQQNMKINQDLSEFRALKYTSKIRKLRIDSEREYEVFFDGFNDDIEVKKDIYNQLSVGDECEIFLSLHSKKVIGARRIHDSLNLI